MLTIQSLIIIPIVAIATMGIIISKKYRKQSILRCDNNIKLIFRFNIKVALSKVGLLRIVSGRLKEWLIHFYGVATKYMESYLSWFR